MYFISSLVLFYFLLQGHTNVLQKICMLLATVSFILWITARFQLADNFSIDAQSKELVKNGLYTWFRHPVYYFSILALCGIALAMNEKLIWCAVCVLTGLEIIRIINEEKVLHNTFGAEYTDYKEKTWF